MSNSSNDGTVDFPREIAFSMDLRKYLNLSLWRVEESWIRMWFVSFCFISCPNLTEEEIDTVLDTVSEFYYWNDADYNCPTIAVFHIEAKTREEAILRGRAQFDVTFEKFEVEIVSTCIRR